MAAPVNDAQAFRYRHSQEVIAIPTRLDNKSGQRIVLLRDVQHAFEDAKTILNGGKAVLFLTDDNFEYLTPLRIAHYPGVVLEVIGATASKSIAEVAGEEATVSTEAFSQESATQDCMSPPLAGKSLHMELSTLSLSETTDGFHSQAPRTVTSTDIESVLHSEDQSNDSNVGSTTETDNPPQVPSNSAVIVETHEGSKDVIQTPCEGTDIDTKSLSQQEEPSDNDNNDTGPLEDMIVVQSGSLTIYTHPSIRAYHQLRNSYLRAINEGRSAQATVIGCAMRELFEKLEFEMVKIREVHQQMIRTQDRQIGVVDTPQEAAKDEEQLDHGPQETVEHYQQHPIHGRQHVEEELQMEEPQAEEPRLSLEQATEEKQEQHRSLHSPENTPPGRMPDIQDRIIAMLTQNYELHEYPYPRLFIILPKELLGSNKLHKPVAGQFRLYFLCECGTHTTPEDCTTLHQVHLAKHQGYDITKPVEFFEKYGRYVLMQMNMVKYGVSTSGLFVPPLACLKIVEGIDTIKENLDYIHKNIETLVDDSIEFLLDLTRGYHSNAVTDRDSMRLDKMEVMEEGERRPLKWYLKRDADRGFGNLYRTVTSRGHVKWACKDHYLAADPKLTVEAWNVSNEYLREDLREVELKRNGYYDGVWNDQAKRTINIRTTLRYKITLSNLYASFSDLSVAVARVNVVDLAVDGFGLSNIVCQCDPIMQLIANGRVQTLRFLSSLDLVSKISISSITRGPKMRVIELQMPFDAESDIGMSYLGRILACYPNLVYIGLRLADQVSLVKTMTIAITKLRKLESLELYYGPFYTAADVSDGNIMVLRMNLPFTKHHIFKDSKIPNYSQDLDEPLASDQLVEILSESPTVEEVVVGYQDLDPMDTIKIVSSAQQKNSDGTKVSPLRRLELVSIRDRLHTPLTRISMAFTQTGVETEVRISQWEDTDSAVYTHFFRSYGATVRALDIMNRTLDDGFARLLGEATKENGSNLRTLGLDVRSLSLAGLESMDRFICRSESLERLELICIMSCIQTEQERVRRFMDAHGMKLTRLILQAHTLDALTVWIEKVLPPRGALPSLIDLQLTLPESLTLQYSHTYVQWLAEMVSSRPSKSSSSSASTAVETLPAEGSCNDAETFSLTRLCLNGIKLRGDEWAKILVAADFSALEELDLKGTNFDFGIVDSLVKGIGLVDSTVPLKILDLSGTSLSKEKTLSKKTPFETLREKAPLIMITGIEHLGVY
ncbi:MAG: hypothetical protein J3Q66DRAFT_336088 [Benniella sp.]|nr:MAG: hypothetical protein J3Q66DRAFT_336088 [Benniella sp.]